MSRTLAGTRRQSFRAGASAASCVAPVGRERRIVAGGLVLATLAAALLRIPFLSTRSFWFDEAYSVHVTAARTFGQLWQRIGATESTPPLFYALAWGWAKLVGDQGEATMRTVSALALIAAAPVAYAALRRLAGWRAALASAALVAVSPLLVSYALDARAYGLLVLTGLLSLWACGALLERATSRRWALWALAAAAAIWTHWFAGFLVLGEALTLLWLLSADGRRGWLLACGAVLLAIVPLVPLLHEQTGDDRAAFIAGDSLAGRVEQLARQFAAGPNVPRGWLEGACIALFLAGLTAGAFLLGRRVRDGEREPRALLAIALIALLVPLALAASGIYDRLNVRNVLFLWPLAAVLAAPSLLRARAIPLLALLALSSATGIWVQADWRYGNADWRGAIRAVEARNPSRPVIAVTALGQPVASLYLDRPPAIAATAAARAWLVVEPARTPGHRAFGPVDAPLLGTLSSAFPSHRERRMHGFRLIELDASRPVTLDPAHLPGATLFTVAARR